MPEALSVIDGNPLNKQKGINRYGAAHESGGLVSVFVNEFKRLLPPPWGSGFPPMADFMGLYDAFGFYKADWFLRFMGVIEGSGKRLDVYTEGLSPNVKAAVAVLTREAANGLEQWTQTEEFATLSYPEMITRMCRAGIAGMIDSDL